MIEFLALRWNCLPLSKISIYRIKYYFGIRDHFIINHELIVSKSKFWILRMKIIKQNTHLNINNDLCGEPIELKEGYSKLQLKMTDIMVTDKKGLIHGGFTFNLADYAAMLAVNHPNVVLGEANVKFIKPIILGDIIIAEGKVTKEEGKKAIVEVSINKDDELVFKGEFICFTLEKHILEKDIQFTKQIS